MCLKMFQSIVAFWLLSTSLALLNLGGLGTLFYAWLARQLLESALL